MNLANKISIGRILLIPFFIASILYYTPENDYIRYIALAIFTVGVFSDALDGYIARMRRQKTRLGIFLDPLADKLLLVSAMICLSAVSNVPEAYRLPVWLPILVISRDIVIVLGVVILFMIMGDVEVRPSKLGKITTFLQMLTVIVSLLRAPYMYVVWSVTAFFTVASGIGYLIRGSRILNASNHA
ncbi:MAG: hypothetical protein AUJ75_01125 [Candidatus Omnitrophica bacterium CG1_02_49_10]|nr:MAG: hypothetical protein AUJ75_01125 [Candidatus Omnitrophica bacterium CG1_02_49_10]